MTLLLPITAQAYAPASVSTVSYPNAGWKNLCMWQGRFSRNNIEHQESLKSLGEAAVHGTEAKIARGNGEEAIIGIESSDHEQRTAAQAKTTEEKTAAIGEL